MKIKGVSTLSQDREKLTLLFKHFNPVHRKAITEKTNPKGNFRGAD